jgi:N4-(beta-N-acetylglucosaminyl)-L-asparaginase
MDRRDFLQAAAGLTVAGLGMGAESMTQDASGQTQTQNPPAPPKAMRPIVIGSANAIGACNRAMEILKQGGDPADAVVAGVNLVEDDPNDHSVGLGGLPNEEGVVQLDSCVMHGPAHKAGAVAALERIRNPSSVALLVMRRSDHVLLVGAGALKFAKAHGFKEEELLTDEARNIWLEWKEKSAERDNWLPPEPPKDAGLGPPGEGPGFTYGTITCQALTAGGDLGGCTSTSGLSWKLAGRVGDSPIIGAGLYVDNDVGSCGSTGRGEANLLNCSSFMIVELMRGGMHPQEACLTVLRRIADKTEKRLRNEKGEPNYGLTFYALRKDGVYGGANLRGAAKMSVNDGTTCTHVALPALIS